MADKAITDAGVIEQIRAALPIVSNDKSGLMSSDKSPEGRIYSIAGASAQNWIRILRGTSAIRCCCGIISCANEWNSSSTYHVAFVVSAMCRQDSSITVLHESRQTDKSIDKVRIVKTNNELYIDIHIVGYLNNNYHFSYSGTAFLLGLSPTTVPAEQNGYIIEEFNL